MKIGIDARMYGREQTGIGRYIKHLTEEIFKQDRENDYVMFLLPHEYKRYQPPFDPAQGKPAPNVRKVMVGSPWYGWHEQLILPWQFLSQRLDLLHVPHFNAPILYPGKFIVTIHDITQLYFPGPRGARQPLRRLAYKVVFGAAVHRAAKVIAVSNYTKGEIMRHFRVPEKKIEVIYEGLPTLAKREAHIANRNLDDKRLAISDKPYILYVGVWRPHKNVVGLLEAFAILKKDPQLPDLKLVLVGNQDPRYPEIRYTITRLNLEPYVIAPGFMSDDELSSHYQQASAVVIPSLMEGFGFVGLEAMQRGIPVAASRTGSLPEILQDYAVYFDPHNPEDIARKIKFALIDIAWREHTKKIAPSMLSQYSWEDTARKTLTVYREFGEHCHSEC